MLTSLVMTVVQFRSFSRLIPFATVLGLLLAFNTVSARAQDVVVDWSTRKVVSSPKEIQTGSQLKVGVTNVNDILYEYSVDVQVTTDNSDDFSLLASLLIPASAASQKESKDGDTCPSAYNQALTDAKTIKDQLSAAGGPFNPEDRPGHVISIPLSTTQQAWNGPLSKTSKDLQARIDVLANNCLDDNIYKAFVIETYPPIKNSLQSIQKKIDGNHTVSGQAAASSGTVVSARISVSEKWKGNETVKSSSDVSPAPLVITLGFSSVLRLSAGVLFSQLQDRSYVSRTVPSTTGTVNTVGANGNSNLTPYLAGLLDYQVPYLHGDKFGLWISSGPTLRITNTGSNTSTFGFFGGISVDLWDRLFITPGIHFGQFAGVPAGLTLGQTIPSNFGQLQPVNRWSARFGFAITYKTLSLGALTKNSNKSSTGTAANVKASPGS